MKLGTISRAGAEAPLTMSGEYGMVTVTAKGEVAVEVPPDVVRSAAELATGWAANKATLYEDVVASMPVQAPADTAPFVAGPLEAWSLAGLYVLRLERDGRFTLGITKTAATAFLAALAGIVAEVDAPAKPAGLPAGVTKVG
jgi:hypothetical protein